MLRRVLIAAVLTAMAQGAGLPKLTGFYVVSVFFSDYGPALYYRVVDVKQDGPDSLVRYIRIAPSNVYCPRMVVQAAEARVRDKSPAQLVGSNNPCPVSPASLHAALKKYAQKAGSFETVSSGIFAQCGRSSVSLGIPIAESANMEQMKATHPEIAALWDLSASVTDQAFGEKDIFHDRSEPEELALQTAGAKLVSELISGRYDTGLAAAVKGNGWRWRSPSFRALLANYHGPLTSAEANQAYLPQLLNARSYQFSHFVLPNYPPLAAAARIQGRVDLQLSVEPSTGEVRDVAALSGHPLLKPSAIDAAKQWRFTPNSVASGGVAVTLDYELRCP